MAVVTTARRARLLGTNATPWIEPVWGDWPVPLITS